MLEACSALSAVMPVSGCDGVGGRRGLQLGERPPGSLVQVGIYPGCLPQVSAAWRAVGGDSLPSSSTVACDQGEHLLFRIALDQYWISSPAAALAARLRAALPEDAASVTALEGARCVIIVAGAAAAQFLGRLVAVDLDPRTFGVGHFAQTPIHHLGGLLYRAAPQRYEFIALRTFAASTFEFIEDAARPYGYDILPTLMPKD